MSRDDLVRVAVPAPLLDPLTYAVPEAFAPRVVPGARVRVPLGRRHAVGLVLERTGDAPPGVALRLIDDALDPEGRPAVPADLLATLRWAIEHYIAPPGDVVRAALPAALAPAPGDAGSRARGAPVTRRVLVPADDVRADPGAALERLARTPARRRVLEAALAGPPAGTGDLARRAQAGAEAVRRLVRDGLLCAREIEIEPPPLPLAELPTARPESLTEAQREAVAWIGERLARGTFHQAVLFGVTGSGKTEVYLRAAERALAAGRPVIFLVPEIGLTPQVARALSARFGEAVSVLHSGMNDRQRFRAWRRARDGEARIVVGARSAIFAPVERPGLIVVDEEHDAGYKQEESPRYHARDLALIRGREAGAVVVYGSATPSMECWSRAGRDVAAMLELPERVGEGRLPEVEVVDMRREFRETKSDDPLSRRLTGLLGETLARGEQAIVLLNRRGYTRALVCRSCGEPVSCGQCSVPMTWHKVGGKLRCHYCAASRSRPESCPACGSEYLADIGSGTQQIEELVSVRLDGARVLRLDRDAARSPARLADTLGRFARGEADVLVGTQMVAKGHHFPRVTLVGVLAADAGLWRPDFRAAERTFALLMQVAGRAGRGERPGRVVVQALKPEHPAIASALAHDYRGFAEREWRARRALRYPPAAAMAVLLVRDEDQMRAFERAGSLRRAIHDAGEGHVAVVGPAVAPLARLRGEWRVQLIVRALKRRRLAQALRAGLERALGESRVMPRWLSVDVDPVQVM